MIVVCRGYLSIGRGGVRRIHQLGHFRKLHATTSTSSSNTAQFNREDKNGGGGGGGDSAIKSGHHKSHREPSVSADVLSMHIPSGVCAVYKPRGFTSSDVVQKVFKKITHTLYFNALL